MRSPVAARPQQPELKPATCGLNGQFNPIQTRAEDGKELIVLFQ